MSLCPSTSTSAPTCGMVSLGPRSIAGCACRTRRACDTADPTPPSSAPTNEGGGVSPSSALLKNLKALGRLRYGVATLLNIVLGVLKLRRRQNISGVWAHPLSLDPSRVHVHEAARGRRMESLKSIVSWGGGNPFYCHISARRPPPPGRTYLLSKTTPPPSPAPSGAISLYFWLMKTNCPNNMCWLMIISTGNEMSQHVRRFFKKANTLFEFCVWTRWPFGGIIFQLGIRNALEIWLKTVPRWAKAANFLYWRPQVLNREAVSYSGIEAQTHNYNYNITYDIFSKFLQGAKYCGPLYRRTKSYPQKLGFLGVCPQK